MSLASSSYDLYRQSLTTGTTEFDKKLQQLVQLERKLALHFPDKFGSKDRYRIYVALFPVTTESPTKLEKLLTIAAKYHRAVEKEQKIARNMKYLRPYVVVSDSMTRSAYGAGPSKLEEAVEEFIEHGFEPVGGVSVESTTGHQAMRYQRNELENEDEDVETYPSGMVNDPTAEAVSSSATAAVASVSPMLAVKPPKAKIVSAAEGGGGGGSLSASGIQKAEGGGGSLRKRKRTQNLRKKSRRTSRR